MKAIHFLELCGNLPTVADPYTMPPNLSPANRALWEGTLAKNERNAKAHAERLEKWYAEQDERRLALRPAGPAPLFDGARFVALETVEHSIHQALGSLRQADDDDRDECGERFDAVVADHPREALRYFIEREQARGESWASMIAILKIRSRLKGNGNDN
jgi:uncharacterized protein YciI